jgi:hypothetical protein
MSLKECTVSMVGQDGQTHEAAVEAASLFDAADRAQWTRLWWYRPNAVVEVRMGGQCWKVNAERIRVWSSKSGGRQAGKEGIAPLLAMASERLIQDH